MTVPSQEAGWALVRQYGQAEHWLAVLSTTDQATGRPGVSVVNAGIIDHPLTTEPIIAFVARGATAKLRLLRRQPLCALVFRHHWEWVGVHGIAELAGPDDPPPFDPHNDRLPQLLRAIYHAAGGHHPDMAQYDEVMAVERRTAVLVRPHRFVTNPPGTEHQEPR